MIQKLEQFATDEKQNAGSAENVESQKEEVLNLRKNTAAEVMQTLLGEENQRREKIVIELIKRAKNLDDYGYKDIGKNQSSRIHQIHELLQTDFGLKLLHAESFDPRNARTAKRFLIVNPKKVFPEGPSKETKTLKGKNVFDRTKSHLYDFPDNLQLLALQLALSGKYGNLLNYDELSERIGYSKDTLLRNMTKIKPFLTKLGIDLIRVRVGNTPYFSTKLKSKNESPNFHRNVKKLKRQHLKKKKGFRNSLPAKKGVSSKQLLTRPQTWQRDYDPIFDDSFSFDESVFDEKTFGPTENVREYDYSKLENPYGEGDDDES